MADVVGWMCEAKEVIIVPGFGLCQGQAQYATAEISKILNEGGVRLRFGIHPVAGIYLPVHRCVYVCVCVGGC